MNNKGNISTPNTQKETERQQIEENPELENDHQQKNKNSSPENQKKKEIFNQTVIKSIVDKPIINVVQGSLTQTQIFDEKSKPNFKGLMHFLLTEFRNIIILHLLYTSMCYSTITTQNINLLIFEFDFDMIRGNIGDLAQCVTEYSFALVSNFSVEKVCKGVEFLICENDVFVGKKNSESDFDNCQFKETKLSNVNDDLVLYILPFISFVCTQICFICNYIFLTIKYYQNGGSFQSGKYFAFTITLESAHWYLLFMIVQSIFFVFVCVTPLVVLTQDIKFQHPNNFLVLIFQLVLAFILIKELFKKNRFVFPFQEEQKKFHKIIFHNQSFWQKNIGFFNAFQHGVYEFQQDSNNLTASFLLKRLNNKDDLKILVNIYQNMYVHIAKSKLHTSSICQSQQLQNLTQSKRIEQLRIQQEGGPTPHTQHKKISKKIANRIQELDEDSSERQQVQQDIANNQLNKPDDSLLNTNDRQNLLDRTLNNNNNNVNNSNIQNPQNRNDQNYLQNDQIITNNQSRNQSSNNLQRQGSADVNQCYQDPDLDKIKQQDKQSNYIQNSVKSAGIVNSAIMHSSCFNQVHIDEFDGRRINHEIHISQQNFLQARKLKMKLKQQQLLNNKLQQKQQNSLNSTKNNISNNNITNN